MNLFDLIASKYQIKEGRRRPVEVLDMTRNDLVQLMVELGLKKGAEIGVEYGSFSAVMADAGMDLWAVDAWKAYPGYREHVSQDKLDEIYASAKALLEPRGVKILRAMSVNAATVIKGGELDFVYIDGNHEFLHVAQDLCLWSGKVRSGGIVAGHDFSRRKHLESCYHVKDVVPAFCNAYGIREWYVAKGESPYSWFYVKP